MFKKFQPGIVLAYAIIVFMLASLSQSASAQSFTELTLDPKDRILILAPHPDDEVLGCSAVIQRALAAKLPVRIVFLTYGDNNQWSFFFLRKHPVFMPRAVRNMGLVRRDEAIAADGFLGVAAENLIFLGYPDFRTLAIWDTHWADSPAAKSMLTEVRAVPYSNAFRPGAAYKGEEILTDLKTIFKEFKPTKIFLSHPADHNGDHRALYLFTRVALWDLKINPEIYPYLVHYKRWPLPGNYHPDLALEPPRYFQDIIWQELKLNEQEIKNKYEAIKKHRSQFVSSRRYLLSFVRSNEMYSDFAPVKLTQERSPVVLTKKPKEDLAELPQELIDQERAAFVGIEKRSVVLEGNDLVITTTLSRPLAKAVGISLYAFGYRQDKDFKDMPKLHVRFGAIEHHVFDQSRLLPADTIKVVRKPREITVSIPLEVLGSPQRILTSANTYMGTVPLDWVAWKDLEITK